MRRFHSVSGSCGALAGKTVLLRKNFLYLIILSQFTPLGFGRVKIFSHFSLQALA